VSLGVRGYAAVRRYCIDPQGNPFRSDVQPNMLDVATRWLQLTDSIAQRISIETDHLVRANGSRTVASQPWRASSEGRSSRATFLTESDDDGRVTVDVDIAGSRICVSMGRSMWQTSSGRATLRRGPDGAPSRRDCDVVR
jgi:hypothetical protein